MTVSSRAAVALVATAALIFSTAEPVAAQPTLVVRRSDTDSVVLGPAQLATLARLDVRATDHGRTATFSGYTLPSVLAAAGVRLDSLRGPALASVLVVEAADGYRVTFSLGELAPDLGGRAVLVADRRDGAALGAVEGPLRLVVAADGRAARWVRQVRRLTIVPVASAR